MAENLTVSGLNFDTIKTNLRNYIANKPEFADYDFADSALNTLLDLLAYNTYYNSFYANMAANEGFLDTAQFYDNVVSRAKALGYVPTSARGASANVKIIFTNSVANTTFRSITVPKNTQFITSINSISYTFVTPRTYTISANSTLGFAQHIDIVEGTPVTHRYTYSSSSNTSFVLPNRNVDTNSISVTVTTNGNTQTYIPASDIFDVTSTSQVFFFDADRDQKYKVYFGDNVLGKKPVTGSQIAISYRVCNGSIPNGANNYSLSGSEIDGQGSIYIIPVGRATGGAEIEDIESIRFNAPRMYETQNRTVTGKDYERVILRDYPDIAAVSTWGGEENEPPIYGKVFVAAKPKIGTIVSSNRKNDIRLSLKKYNVQSIDVEIVDPTYIYVIPSVITRYNTTKTTYSSGEMASIISNRIISYESEYLSQFNKNFRYSKFLEYIDDVNDAIETSTAVIRLRKTFSPSTTNINSYTINFNNTLQRLGTSSLISGVPTHPGFGSITSSSFTYQGYNCYFDDNGFGTLRIYYKSADARLGRSYINYNAGTIDYERGIISINDFLPSNYNGDTISIIAAPVNNNIQPIRNQIVLLSQAEVSVVDDVTGVTLATTSNIETVGQTATLLTPSRKSYTF